MMIQMILCAPRKEETKIKETNEKRNTNTETNNKTTNDNKPTRNSQNPLNPARKPENKKDFYELINIVKKLTDITTKEYNNILSLLVKSFTLCLKIIQNFEDYSSAEIKIIRKRLILTVDFILTNLELSFSFQKEYNNSFASSAILMMHVVQDLSLEGLPGRFGKLLIAPLMYVEKYLYFKEQVDKTNIAEDKTQLKILFIKTMLNPLYKHCKLEGKKENFETFLYSLSQIMGDNKNDIRKMKELLQNQTKELINKFLPIQTEFIGLLRDFVPQLHEENESIVKIEDTKEYLKNISKASPDLKKKHVNLEFFLNITKNFLLHEDTTKHNLILKIKMIKKSLRLLYKKYPALKQLENADRRDWQGLSVGELIKNFDDSWVFYRQFWNYIRLIMDKKMFFSSKAGIVINNSIKDFRVMNNKAIHLLCDSFHIFTKDVQEKLLECELNEFVLLDQIE